MGSRTGASSSSIIGKNRNSSKDIARLSSSLASMSISHSLINLKSDPVPLSNSSPLSSSVPQIGTVSMSEALPRSNFEQISDIGQSSFSGSKEECEISAKIAMGILVKSNPVLTVIYYTLKFSEMLVEWLPEIEEAHQRGGDDAVVQLLIEKALKIGLNIGVNMLVNEISDQVWISLKTHEELKTTPNQDQIAKFAINQILSVTIDAIKERKPLTREFVYRETYNALFDLFSDSLMESKNEGTTSGKIPPYFWTSNMSPDCQVLLKETVKEFTKEIVDEFLARSGEGRTPRFKTMKKRFEEIVVEHAPSVVPEDFCDNISESTWKNIIVTDEESVKLVPNSVILTTNNKVNDEEVDKYHRIKLNFTHVKREQLTPEEKDLANFAAFLFRMEYLIRQKPKSDGLDENILPRKVIFTAHSEMDDETIILMRRLTTLLLGYNPPFQIRRIIESASENNREPSPEKIDAICLFSGGLDSTIGYFEAIKRYQKFKLVFVNPETSQIAKYVNELVESWEMSPNLLKSTSFSGGEFLQQTRGFLYLTAAAIYANHFKAADIVVSECGVTKYQPTLSVADEITKTTNPLMLALATALFKKKGITVAIKSPFDDFTKAEMISFGKENEGHFKSTYSCRGYRTPQEGVRECGYCMGCLIKNICLTYVTGKKQVQFALDPLTNSNSFSAECGNPDRHSMLNYNKIESALILIDFTTKFLRNDGTINQTTNIAIKDYGKSDLFRRFSEDIIYGLSFMKKNNMLQNETVLERLATIENEPWFKYERINGRREELLKQNKTPFWD
jgi:7-cyano-7-deazaguanine synthase in queuosine biosynthesis